MKERIIIHADLNHCYAQIEEMLHPELRFLPMAVGGSEKARHGIILAKNDLAKAAGIKTAENLRSAYRKCPHLLVVPPHYQDYLYYTEQVKNIYREYTDQVESFGLDEAWIDISDSLRLFGDPLKVAKTMQERIYQEIGLTVSMGISFNKIFAKLGSDLNKKKGFVVITRENFREKFGQLPVGDLFYVGPATEKKLRNYHINTIAQLADTPYYFLQKKLGKHGEMLWRFANGYDDSEVKNLSYIHPVKSIGNGVTAAHDLRKPADLQIVARILSEAVASRLREQRLMCQTISVHLRDKNLCCFSRQKTLAHPSDIASEILECVLSLCADNCPLETDKYYITSYRSISIEAHKLQAFKNECEDDLFGRGKWRRKERKLECTIDKIRERFGFSSIQSLSCLNDRELSNFNPREDHIIHPEGWF